MKYLSLFSGIGGFDMNNKELQKLKTAMSEILLDHIADKLDMTVGEYGSVYDSEEHERVLNKMARLVQSLLKQAELRAKREELNTMQTTWLKLGDPECGVAIDKRLAELESSKAEMENLS
jgi:phosphoribosyl-dephospho-CoA transferase